MGLTEIKAKILHKTDRIFNILYENFESAKSYRIISTSLVFVFVIFIGLIFLNNFNILPKDISELLPTNYFSAIELVFKLLLAIEIISMVFILAYSVSDSMAKQFEILSLILLRQAFKEFSYVDFPIDIYINYNAITYMLSDIFGALIIFAGIYLFKKLQKHRSITQNELEKSKFVSVKKLLALFMILSFFIIAIYDFSLYIISDSEFNFFALFYTSLIFMDILIVIISLRYSHSYSVVTRNTGFAIATILIRLALSLPHYFDALLGIIAMIYVILLSIIYNKFELKMLKPKELIMKKKFTENSQ